MELENVVEMGRDEIGRQQFATDKWSYRDARMHLKASVVQSSTRIEQKIIAMCIFYELAELS